MQSQEKVSSSLFRHRWYPLMVLGAFALIVLGMMRTVTPTAPVDSSAPQSAFSSGRAFADLTDLIKEDVPHPAGSAANKVIRDRIVNKLKGRGLPVEVQAGFSCIPHEQNCSYAENIIAVKKGTVGKKAIMLMAHYDSVPGGAGAGDDGLGVASMLEIANVLQQEDAYENDVVLLFTDAEELGLNGAQVFADHHSLMEKVSVIINIESRGTSGQSSMFETSPQNYQLIDVYQSVVERPSANSLTYEIYKRMPNDTDYTVFRKKGIAGLNFASSRSASRYHSVKDNLENLDQGTLQQHGINALNTLRAFSNMDLTTLADADGDATYFDAFSTVLVKWPSGVNAPFSVIAFLVLLVLVWANRKTEKTTAGQLIWSAGNIFLVISAVVGISALLAVPLGIWIELHPLDHVNPWPSNIAAWAGIFFGIIFFGVFTRNKVSFKSQLLVGWTVIALISVIVSFMISGAAYFTMAPLMAFFAGLIIDGVRTKFKIKNIDFLVSAHLGFLAAAYMAVYHFSMLDLVLNFNFLAIRAIPFVLMGFALLPLCHQYYRENTASYRLHLIVTVVAMVVGTVVSTQVPSFTKDKPNSMNLLYVADADKKQAFWTVESIFFDESEHFVTMGFPAESTPITLYGIWETERPIRPAVYQALPAPEFTIISDITSNDSRAIEADLKAGHGGFDMYLTAPDKTSLEAFEVNGQSVFSKSEVDDEDTHFFASLGAAQEMTFHVKIVLKKDMPFSLTISEQADLADTPEAKSILERRPEIVQEMQDGNRSIVQRTINF